MKTLIDKILERLDTSTDHWQWTGPISSGSIQTYYQGKHVTVRRALYEYYIGAIPSNSYIYTSCEIKYCCTPEHLILKSDVDPVSLFWSKVDIKNPDECWEWQSSTNKDGYGRFYPKGARWMANRYSYQLAHPEITLDAENIICHTCDNPPCVNPDHLFLGTTQDNVTDKINKERHSWGEKHSNCKVSDNSIYEMYKLYEEDGISIKELAIKYGLHYSHTSKIVTGRARKTNYAKYHGSNV